MTLRCFLGLLAPLVGATILVGATGCGNLALSAADSFAGNTPVTDVPSDGGTFGDVAPVGLVAQDASSVPGAPATQGSPLCGVLAGGGVCETDLTNDDAGAGATCTPVPVAAADSGAVGSPDSGTGDDAAPDEDASAPEDAGMPTPVDAGSGRDAGAGPDVGGPSSTTMSCRVTETDAGSFTPQCGVAGQGGDGAACTTGSDCAPTFECVGPSGQGVCRRYCCNNDCSVPGGSVAADAAAPGPPGPIDAGPYVPAAFCDIEPMADKNYEHLVPVCVTKPTCALFQPCPVAPNTTASGEACTIVDANGTTACILPGPQDVGESCEENHCKAGLACWGLFPQRTCVQLCDASNPCSNGACQSNYSNFGKTDTSAGICPAQ